VKLLDEGKLNLDDPVQKYVPNFPEKQINYKPCIITVRQLLCHQSGIRHYHKTKKAEENTDKTNSKYNKCQLNMPCGYVIGEDYVIE
jgi:CubicO group peptidase (beta-lactamase class C family)